MPRYYCTGTKVRLATAPLEAAITPVLEVKKGSAAAEKTDQVENVLKNARILSEEIIPIGGEAEESKIQRVHFIGKHGNIPFMMVRAGEDLFTVGPTKDIALRRASNRQSHGRGSTGPPSAADPTIRRESEKEDKEDMRHDNQGESRRTSATSRSTRARPETSNQAVAPLPPLAQGIKYSGTAMLPQALCLHVVLSDRTFLRDFSPNEKHQDVKIDVFYNGMLSACSFVAARDRRKSNAPKAMYQVFAGSRVKYLVERPWVILPPGQEADGTLRGMKRSKIAGSQERWEQIATALMAEADERGVDEWEDRSPTGDYLESLANLPMPEAIEDLQKPGGRKFGVIDVVITAGAGSKLLGAHTYLKRPTRLEDPRYSPVSLQQKQLMEKRQQAATSTSFAVDPKQRDERTSPQIATSACPFDHFAFTQQAGASEPTVMLNMAAARDPIFFQPSPALLMRSKAFNDAFSNQEAFRYIQDYAQTESAHQEVVNDVMHTRPPFLLSASSRSSTPFSGSSHSSSTAGAFSMGQNHVNVRQLNMPPPSAPASASTLAACPMKRQRVNSLPSLQNITVKKRRISMGAVSIEEFEPHAPPSSTPPASFGISRRGIFIQPGSPRDISPRSTYLMSLPEFGGRVIQIDDTPPQYRNQLDLPGSRSSNRVGAAAMTPRRPSLIVQRVVITARGQPIVDKQFTVAKLIRKTPPKFASSARSGSAQAESPDWIPPHSLSTFGKAGSRHGGNPATPPPSSPTAISLYEGMLRNTENGNGIVSAPPIVPFAGGEINIGGRLACLLSTHGHQNALDEALESHKSTGTGKGDQLRGPRGRFTRTPDVTPTPGAGGSPIIIENPETLLRKTTKIFKTVPKPKPRTDFDSVSGQTSFTSQTTNSSNPNSTKAKPTPKSKITLPKANSKARKPRASIASSNPDADFSISAAADTPTPSRRREQSDQNLDREIMETPTLSQDCVITYAKSGLWRENKGAPTGTENADEQVLRQIRCERPGWFKEEEVVFGVRFLIG